MTCINYKDIGLNENNKHILYVELWDDSGSAPNISTFDGIVGFPKSYTYDDTELATGSYCYSVNAKKLYFYDGSTFVEQ